MTTLLPGNTSDPMFPRASHVPAVLQTAGLMTQVRYPYDKLIGLIEVTISLPAMGKQ